MIFRQKFWRLYFIDFNVRTLVLAIQRWQFWLKQQRVPRSTKKFSRWTTRGIVGWDQCQMLSDLAEVNGNGLKVSKLGVIHIEAKRYQKVFLYTWIVTSMARKERFFVLYHHWRWKTDTLQYQEQKIIVQAWPTIHINNEKKKHHIKWWCSIFHEI